MVRAKFVVDSIAKTRQGGHHITMSPVCSDTPENKTFWKWTPSGRIEFQCINEAAVNQFEVGKEYYVDFTEAVKEG
jgi:hypothetical protein